MAELALRNRVRIVTAAALFDGHDAAINIMRRLMQRMGAEVIHLGHNRGAAEIVDAAVMEDAQAVAITSYQGGHIEFFKYIVDLLKERGAGHVKVFGGAGASSSRTRSRSSRPTAWRRSTAPRTGGASASRA